MYQMPPFQQGSAGCLILMANQFAAGFPAAFFFSIKLAD